MAVEHMTPTVTVAKSAPHGHMTTTPHLSRHVETYLKLRRVEVAKSSSDSDRARLVPFIRYVSQFTGDIRKVDDAMIAAYFATAAERGLSRVSLRSYHITIKTFFKYLVTAGVIRKNPMLHMKPPRKPQILKDILRDDEIGLLFDACECSTRFINARNKAIVAVLLDTGLRVSELTNMKMSDFEGEYTVASVLKKKPDAVSFSRFKVNGKGNKERVLRLDKETQQYLARYLALRVEVDYDAVWLTEERTPITREGVQRILLRLGQLCGVHANPHKFRRTFAVMCLRNGATPFDVQALLGHEDLAMTRYYAKLYSSGDACTKHESFSPMKGLRR